MGWFMWHSMHMKAVLCKQYGPPETLTFEELPSPKAGPGEVVISMKAASVNFPDVLIIQNKYQFKPPLPFSPGSELSGIVKEVGEGVSRFKPGDKVMAFTGYGAFAEEVKYPGPQEAAPNVYHQIFDNERVRVSEITFKPGDKAAMHTHPYDHSLYVLEAGTLTLSHPDGTSQVVNAEVGQVMFMKAETHEAVNTGTTQFRALVTELK